MPSFTNDLGVTYTVEDFNKLEVMPPGKFKTLDFTGTRLHRLPSGIVTHTLKLGQTRIKKIPSNIQIEGNLDLRLSQVEELPDGLEVGLNLYVCGSQVARLPHNLVVKGCLYLRGGFHDVLTSIGTGIYAHQIFASHTRAITETIT